VPKTVSNIDSGCEKIAIKTFNAETLRQMNLFKQIAHTSPLDCFEVNNAIVFLTPKGKASKAIGKGGINIKKIKDSLKRDVKVMEGGDDAVTLTKNFVFPIRPNSVEIVDNNGQKEIHIQFKGSRDRRQLLDYGQKNLKLLKTVIARYYKDIKDIRVL